MALLNWKSLTRSQKTSLFFYLLILFFIPLSVFTALIPTRSTSRAQSDCRTLRRACWEGMPCCSGLECKDDGVGYTRCNPISTPTPKPVGFEQATNFDGTTGYITTSGNSTQNVNYTVEAWIKPESKLYPNTWGYFASSTTYNRLNWGLISYSESGKIYLRGGAAVPGPRTINWVVPLQANVWQHIALVANNDQGSINVYINGEKVFTENYSPQYSPGAYLGPLNLTIGGTDFGSSGPGIIDKKFLYKGQVDELRISNGSRYSENFTPLTKPFSTDSSTLALYHFDNDAQDSSGNNNNGTVIGNVQFVTSTIITPTPTPTRAPIPSPTNIPGCRTLRRACWQGMPCCSGLVCIDDGVGYTRCISQ